MKIAVLGWGSLKWRPETLCISSVWFPDGPELPIEFSRKSKDGSLTLVLCPHGTKVHVLWAIMAVDELGSAIENLRKREKTKTSKIGFVNLCSDESMSNIIPNIVDKIRQWADGKNVDAVIWTDLPQNFKEQTETEFTEEYVIRYLINLPDQAKRKAEEYIRKAPEQIKTRFRAAIEKELGWTPIRT